MSLRKRLFEQGFFPNQQVMVCLFCQPALLICCLPQRMEMLQFSKKLPKSPVLQSPEVRQMVINSKPLITKHWTAT